MLENAPKSVVLNSTAPWNHLESLMAEGPYLDIKINATIIFIHLKNIGYISL